jgi:hypothetical protein
MHCDRFEFHDRVNPSDKLFENVYVGLSRLRVANGALFSTVIVRLLVTDVDPDEHVRV